MKITTWTYPDGTEGHTTLPKTWRNVSGITEANASRLGFVKVEVEVPDPPVIHIYSKYLLIRALMKEGLWDVVKQAITDAGCWDLWEACNELSSDDEIFTSVLEQMKAEYGEEKVEEILAQALR